MSEDTRDSAVEWVRRQLAWEGVIERAAEASDAAEAPPRAPGPKGAPAVARRSRSSRRRRVLRSEPTV